MSCMRSTWGGGLKVIASDMLQTYREHELLNFDFIQQINRNDEGSGCPKNYL